MLSVTRSTAKTPGDRLIFLTEYPTLSVIPVRPSVRPYIPSPPSMACFWFSTVLFVSIICLCFVQVFFKQIVLIQSYQSLEVNRLTPVLWKRSDSVTNQVAWECNSINSVFFVKTWINSRETTLSSWLVYKSASVINIITISSVRFSALLHILEKRWMFLF